MIGFKLMVDPHHLELKELTVEPHNTSLWAFHFKSLLHHIASILDYTLRDFTADTRNTPSIVVTPVGAHARGQMRIILEKITEKDTWPPMILEDVMSPVEVPCSPVSVSAPVSRPGSEGAIPSSLQIMLPRLDGDILPSPVSRPPLPMRRTNPGGRSPLTITPSEWGWISHRVT